MNPVVRDLVSSVLGSFQNYLIDPLNIKDMHNLLNQSYMVMTILGCRRRCCRWVKPVLVLRNVTERPEGLGWNSKVRTKKETIARLHRNYWIHLAYNEMAKATNPFGDGKASARIVNAILNFFSLSSEGYNCTKQVL